MIRHLHAGRVVISKQNGASFPRKRIRQVPLLISKIWRMAPKRSILDKYAYSATPVAPVTVPTPVGLVGVSLGTNITVSSGAKPLEESGAIPPKNGEKLVGPEKRSIVDRYSGKGIGLTSHCKIRAFDRIAQLTASRILALRSTDQTCPHSCSLHPSS